MEEEKKERKKGGRPKKEKKRMYKMSFNVTADERDSINGKSELSGYLRTATFLRDLAIKGKIRKIPTPEEYQAYRDLSGMANNLNQLTKKAHQEDLATFSTMFLKLIKEINQLIKSLDNKNENRG